MKILIIHDYFKFRGGAERLVLIMARALKADILCSFWSDKNSFSRTAIPNKIFTLMEKEPPRTGWRYFRYQCVFYFKTNFIKKYDLVIFSGNNCLSASHNVNKKARKIFYCHSPVRYAYDLKKYYLDKKNAICKPLLYAFIVMARFVYKFGINRMDKIIANSHEVQKRIKRYLNKDSTIIYPPIETDKFRWIDQKDYYLSYGRVDELKRIEIIVEAFIHLPDKKLIVASGGPNLENIKKMAYKHDNIRVLGWVDDQKLKELIGNCIATLYVPVNEDFGMTPLEGMSAGKPCIGVSEGGLKETIIHEKTGLLIPADFKLEDLIAAIKKMDSQTAIAMKINCIAQVQKFSTELFIEKIKILLD